MCELRPSDYHADRRKVGMMDASRWSESMPPNASEIHLWKMADKSVELTGRTIRSTQMDFHLCRLEYISLTEKALEWKNYKEQMSEKNYEQRQSTEASKL